MAVKGHTRAGWAGGISGPTSEQRRTMERWEGVGWTLLHWTEVAEVMAVMESPLGDVVFIDQNGWAWKGPVFRKSDPVPLEKYPPIPQ